MKFDRGFEEDILSRCFRDQKFLQKAAPLLEAHHFGSAQHAWVWQTIQQIWNTYREPPKGKVLVARAKRDFTKDEDVKVHLELIKKIVTRKARSAASILKELEMFVRAVNAQRVLEEAAKELEKNKVEKCWEVLNKASRQDVKPRDYQVVHWVEEFKDRQLERKFNKEHPGHIVRIPTGFKQLDHILGGGIETSELGLVVATTGRGKSITLSNLAFWSAASGFPTVYFTLEMPAKQIAQRMDSRWSHLDYKKFKLYDFLPSELRLMNTKLKHAKTRMGGKLIIVETPVRKTTVPDLIRCVEDLYEDHGFEPKMIVVDSGDHMSATRRYESYRLDQAEVYWGLSFMAQQGPYAVWSSTHAGKEWKDDTAEAEAVSESYDKARIASIVVSLNVPKKKSRSTKVTTDDDEDEDEKEDPSKYTRGKYMELRLGKYRDGEDKITIPMDAQFARMYINEAEDADDEEESK
jgi:replicative DNA helicase